MNKVIQDQVAVPVAVERPEGGLHLVARLLHLGAEEDGGGAALQQQLQGQGSLLEYPGINSHRGDSRQEAHIFLI